MYIEASNQADGDSARLTTGPIVPTGGYMCLAFFCHMYGLDTGTLNVYQVVRQGDVVVNMTNIWTKTGQWFCDVLSAGHIHLYCYMKCCAICSLKALAYIAYEKMKCLKFLANLVLALLKWRISCCLLVLHSTTCTFNFHRIVAGYETAKLSVC